MSACAHQKSCYCCFWNFIQIPLIIRTGSTVIFSPLSVWSPSNLAAFDGLIFPEVTLERQFGGSVGWEEVRAEKKLFTFFICVYQKCF